MKIIYSISIVTVPNFSRISAFLLVPVSYRRLFSRSNRDSKKKITKLKKEYAESLNLEQKKAFVENRKSLLCLKIKKRNNLHPTFTLSQSFLQIKKREVQSQFPHVFRTAINPIQSLSCNRLGSTYLNSIRSKIAENFAWTNLWIVK